MFASRYALKSLKHELALCFYKQSNVCLHRIIERLNGNITVSFFKLNM